MKSEEMNQFVLEGVSNYGKAYDAISLFREELKKRLEVILRSKKDWRRFQPRHDKKAVWSENRRNRGEYWICACVEGHCGTEKAHLYIGVWWNSTISADAVFYTHFEGSEVVQHFPHSAQKEGILTVDLEAHTYLYLFPAKDADLDRDFNLLVDELQEAVTRMVPVQLTQ
jgi:hypothetical protein